ncbi:alpha/beta hydrolase [Martelella mediterranea]|uniref:alpha/beta hydrolase n=1 Tax=Martelella mediterranea TaxID=293089 RepID=UPI001FE18E00|nr:alpha/beta fold hydrolase [Martelella mediterranea]
MYPQQKASAKSRVVTVYVATTREAADKPVEGFTVEREEELSYAAFDISIPPNHEPGEIEWPYSRKVNLDEQFAVLKHTILTQSAFESMVAREARKSKDRRAAIFVHGFNVSFQEGLFRMAQLAADSNVSGVPILFSWPSQARVLDYATDKESATFSRDGLTEVLQEVTGISSVRSVMLFGHSMGGWLSMEALRQLALTGDRNALRKLNVILAAPDIDEDVFTTQLEAIGPLDPPILVMVSSDDRALQASRFIQGNRQRAGQLDITDPEVIEQAREMNVTLLDISSLSSSDALNHSRYAALAAIYPELNDDMVLGSGMRSAGAKTLDAVARAVSAPFALAENAIAP